jgi:hypothetical protein
MDFPEARGFRLATNLNKSNKQFLVIKFQPMPRMPQANLPIIEEFKYKQLLQEVEILGGRHKLKEKGSTLKDICDRTPSLYGKGATPLRRAFQKKFYSRCGSKPIQSYVKELQRLGVSPSAETILLYTQEQEKQQVQEKQQADSKTKDVKFRDVDSSTEEEEQEEEQEEEEGEEEEDKESTTSKLSITEIDLATTLLHRLDLCDPLPPPPSKPAAMDNYGNSFSSPPFSSPSGRSLLGSPSYRSGAASALSQITGLPGDLASRAAEAFRMNAEGRFNGTRDQPHLIFVDPNHSSNVATTGSSRSTGCQASCVTYSSTTALPSLLPLMFPTLPSGRPVWYLFPVLRIELS